MKSTIRLPLLIALAGALLLVLAASFGCSGGGGTAGPTGTAEAQYYCPMHTTYTSDKPGNCPICGMKLVPIPKTPTPPVQGAAAPAGRKILFYRNPMDPSITSPVPMKDNMGMDYVPVYEEQAQPAGGTIAGLAPVVLSQQSLDLAGVQTAVATTERIERVIRTVGSVVPDETRIRHVHTRVSGYIQKLYVNYTGQLVKKGAPILEIYSPELLASQQEFIRALETARQFANSSIPEVRQGGQDLVNSSRRRLELFDVPASFIEKLETTGQVQRNVTLVAPVSGYLAAKNVFEGQQVEPGTELFTITDLSRVWIMADIYEYEASSVRLGQMATLTAAYDPSVQLNARISFISPTLNADSRTLRVRFDAPNARLALKPDMYVNVELQVNGGEGVAFPDSAVMDTGTRQIVFVETAPGRFEPRQVHVTNRAAGMVQVDSGVAAGERVVVKANFLLDSESRLTAAISGANAGQQGGGAQ